MKRAQVETMGLMIIVILIVIGALLYLRFGILQSEPTTSVDKIQNIQAINLINAIMNIQICEELSVKEVVVSCENSENIQCCNTLEPEISSILGKTADFNNQFFILKNNVQIIQIPEELVCEAGIASPSYTFTGSGDVYEAYFMLCQ